MALYEALWRLFTYCCRAVSTFDNGHFVLFISIQCPLMWHYYTWQNIGDLSRHGTAWNTTANSTTVFTYRATNCVRLFAESWVVGTLARFFFNSDFTDIFLWKRAVIMDNKPGLETLSWLANAAKERSCVTVFQFCVVRPAKTIFWPPHSDSMDRYWLWQWRPHWRLEEALVVKSMYILKTGCWLPEVSRCFE